MKPPSPSHPSAGPPDSTEPVNRRQLKTRGRAWPSAIARGLARAGVSPNQVSVASIGFAAATGCMYWSAGERVGEGGVALRLIVAAACIQLRLLCNLLDGLLAIEGGLKSRTGDLYNEIPDRVADILILLGAGVAIHELVSWGLALGVAATILALITAYIRLLGGSLGFVQDFSGPMAKQHRMFTLTLGSIAGAVEYPLRGSLYALVVALVAIAVGSFVTAVRRTLRIARQLETR